MLKCMYLLGIVGLILSFQAYGIKKKHTAKGIQGPQQQQQAGQPIPVQQVLPGAGQVYMPTPGPADDYAEAGHKPINKSVHVDLVKAELEGEVQRIPCVRVQLVNEAYVTQEYQQYSVKVAYDYEVVVDDEIAAVVDKTIWEKVLKTKNCTGCVCVKEWYQVRGCFGRWKSRWRLVPKQVNYTQTYVTWQPKTVQVNTTKTIQRVEDRVGYRWETRKRAVDVVRHRVVPVIVPDADYRQKLTHRAYWVTTTEFDGPLPKQLGEQMYAEQEANKATMQQKLLEQKALIEQQQAQLAAEKKQRRRNRKKGQVTEITVEQKSETTVEQTFETAPAQQQE